MALENEDDYSNIVSPIQYSIRPSIQYVRALQSIITAPADVNHLIRAYMEKVTKYLLAVLERNITAALSVRIARLKR